MNINAYLNFDGRCEEALNFYAEIFGGRIESMDRWGNSPMCDNVGPEWQEKVIHATLMIGESTIMASDSPPEFCAPVSAQGKPQGINIALSLGSLERAEQIFNALAERGSVFMPMEKTFWAERFGMVIDEFNIPWMINCEPAASQA
jgi:PhnB protein